MCTGRRIPLRPLKQAARTRNSPCSTLSPMFGLNISELVGSGSLSGPLTFTYNPNRMTWAQLGATIAIEIGVCSLLDFVLSDKEIKRSHLSLVRWWNELDEFNVAETVRRSSGFFVRLFDVVYGPRAFSLRRVGMSVLTTV